MGWGVNLCQHFRLGGCVLQSVLLQRGKILNYRDWWGLEYFTSQNVRGNLIDKCC